MATIVLTSGTSWIAPADWNNSNNAIYLIGGGGGGSGSAMDTGKFAGGAGGGGGAYTKLTNVTLTPNVAYTIAIGAAGTAGAAVVGGTSSTGGNGGNTTFNNGVTTFTANGGAGGSVTTATLASTGGTGGAAQAVSGLITQAFAGGNGGDGGTNTANGQASGGGGGAGGPSGRGGNGGSCLPNTGAGMAGGGGGGNGGGSNGGSSTTSAGSQAGGNNYSGVGGGAAGLTGAGTPASAGNNGGGGGSSRGGSFPGDGGNGGDGIDITSSVGGGGGAGGVGNGTINSPASGKRGGLYGGGGSGGACHINDNVQAGVAGAQGLIVIIYNPSVKTVFITATGAGTFTVPLDFQSFVSVEAIGGGGNGGTAGRGGGGGAYAKSTAVTGLAAGRTAFYQVGGASTDTWFNTVSAAAPTLTTQGVLAKGASLDIISHVSSAASVQNTASTTITVTIPAVSDGNLMVMILSSANTAGTWTTPTGWTSHNSSLGRVVYSRVASAEPANYTVTHSVSSTFNAFVTVYSNAFVDRAGFNTGAESTTITPNAIQVDEPNSTIIYHIRSTGANSTYTTPTGYTQRQTDSDATGPSGAIFDLRNANTAAGSYTAPSTTSTVAGLSVIVVLSPSGAIGGAGGAASSCVGTTVYSGGAGGSSLNVNNRGGGGGGAAGPTGAGWKGGDSLVAADANGGGGGAGGGSGSVGQDAAATVEGAGGNGPLGSGGGVPEGGSGTAGTGGGGAGESAGGAIGGAGATYNYWLGTSGAFGTPAFYTEFYAGPGGGGGGSAGGSSVGGAGGLYGGGAGCATSTGGTGAQGIIVFTYVASSLGINNFPYQPATGFKTISDETSNTQDLGQRYITKDYLLDAYPNIASATGARVAPGLWAWGFNPTLQLGINTSTATNYSSPVQIGALANWKDVSAGYGSSFSIRTDGTLWAWGGWRYTGGWTQGELGLGTNGIYYSSPVQVGALTNWKQISAGVVTIAAVKTDGTLWTWGLNNSSAINLGFTLGCNGIMGNGNTVNYSSPVQIGALTNWKQVAMSARTCHAIKTDGTLWAWGHNYIGSMGTSYGGSVYYSSPVQVGALTNWKQIAADEGAVAVKTDGTLWTWGVNTSGQLGNDNRTSYSSPIQVGTLTNWKQVSATGGGFMACYAIKTDGTLWAWGNNANGQLGNGNRTSYSSPIQVGTLTNWKKVVGQSFTVYAIKTDGTLWTWGRGVQGQFGTGFAGGAAYYSSPIQVGSLTNWKNIPTTGAAGQHMLAIQDGYI
jgi:alpha-tubulin suppressor-like RCC1 family protein